MPFYEIHHHYPLTSSQKSELASAITHIHSTTFSTPKLFVNVRFCHNPTDSGINFVGGVVRPTNHVRAHVRSGPSRTRQDWQNLSNQIQSAWGKIVGPGLPSVRRAEETADGDTSLHSIIILGDLIFGMELGFAYPEAGGDVEWLRSNMSEFEKRAEAGDDEIKGMVDEVKERGLLGDGKTAQQRLEEALGWGDSA